MNNEISTLMRELDESRRAVHQTKEVLKVEANPVNRFRRSWIAKKNLWLGGGAAVVGVLALLLLRRKPAKPPIPPGYVIVTPSKPSSRWVGLLKFAMVAAKPAFGAWVAWRNQAMRH